MVAHILIDDGVKGKCRSPQGSRGKDLTTGTFTYKCVWEKCRYNSQCSEGYCCTDDPNGPKTGEGKRVPKGTIIIKMVNLLFSILPIHQM